MTTSFVCSVCGNESHGIRSIGFIKDKDIKFNRYVTGYSLVMCLECYLSFNCQLHGMGINEMKEYLEWVETVSTMPIIPGVRPR